MKKIVLVLLLVLVLDLPVQAQRPDADMGQQVFVPTKKNGVVASAQTAGQATQFIDYPGAQPPAWPMTLHPVLLPKFSMPVYAGYPDRPYDVIGRAYVRLRPDGGDPRGSAIKLLIEIARMRNADALLLLPYRAGLVEYYAGADAVKWRQKAK